MNNFLSRFFSLHKYAVHKNKFLFIFGLFFLVVVFSVKTIQAAPQADPEPQVSAEVGSKSAAIEIQENITVEQARLLVDQVIDEGGDLSVIPKKVWKQILTPQQFYILWKKGTERPFTGSLLENKQKGTYVTAGCRLPVFHSSQKYKSGTGWPSFWDTYKVDNINKADNIKLEDDWSWMGRRTEVLSACGEHLGHVFPDGPEPTGLRYCINSDALLFIPDDADGE